MKIKGVIFDFNGVIVDDYPLQKQVWDKISSEIRGRPVSDSEMLQQIRGVPTRSVIKWLADNELDETEVNQFAEKKQELIKELYLVSPLFELNKGLEELLNQLKQRKMPITIVTSSGLEMTLFSFKRLGLERWFSFNKIIYNDGKHEDKPNPGPYLLAARKLNLEAELCLVFEDSQAGIEAAHKAGIGRIIAVGSEEHLLKMRKLPGVKEAIHDFREISLKTLLN